MGSFTLWVMVFAALLILSWSVTLYIASRRNSRWLNVYSQDSAFFVDHVMRKNIHLRQVFGVAMAMESRGEAFYRRLAEKAVREDVKALCVRLAEAEVRHRQWLEEKTSRWQPVPLDDATLSSFENEFKYRGIFSAPPGPDAAEEEMVQYAIKQEKAFEAFYRSFESAFPEAWKIVRLMALATEEMKHAADLVAAYPQFKSMI